jgi:hypothetical protein
VYTIELRGAGDRVLVTLERRAGAWTVRERTGWPADPGLVRALLDELATARRVEAKTAMPDRHARIGVEAVSGVDATGVEVRLRGKAWSDAVVVGKAPPAAPGRFVRRSADAQAWRVDRRLDVAREPAAWLDTRLFDEPLPRVDRVWSRDDAGHEFSLVHRDDRFRIAEAPSAAMGDSYRGDTLAAVLTDLRIEDVAVDEGAAAERTVTFALKDGRRITLESRRIDGRVWTRAYACPADVRDCDSTRSAGRRYLLPARVAADLWLTRDQILGRTP